MTKRSNWSSGISVRFSSPVPVSSSLDSPCFEFDQGVDLLFDRAAADEFMHQDILLLSDAEGAIGGLVLHRGVPPAIEVHDM